jgi:hypothetical protein
MAEINEERKRELTKFLYDKYPIPELLRSPSVYGPVQLHTLLVLLDMHEMMQIMIDILSSDKEGIEGLGSDDPDLSVSETEGEAQK